MANSPHPVYSTLAVSDGTTTTNLPAFTAGTPEALGYDLDGNLTAAGPKMVSCFTFYLNLKTPPTVRPG